MKRVTYNKVLVLYLSIFYGEEVKRKLPHVHADNERPGQSAQIRAYIVH